ncbi:thioredoxin-related transmembrane protein 2 [Sarcoptes scabiei]|nr:thioredoxin-related transmembrane protein 2 [Sarcoptes scabiei]
MNPTRSIYSSLKRFMQYIFDDEPLPQHKPIGLITIEHDCAIQPDQYDGICLTLLVICKDFHQCLDRCRSGFTWIKLNQTLSELVRMKLSTKHQTILHTAI